MILMLRLAFPVLLLALILGGCAGGSIVTKGDDAEISKLKAENDGIILLYTSLHDVDGGQVMATFARPNEKGRYVGWRSFQLKPHGGAAGMPAQLKIPAGDYAIVELRSSRVTAAYPLRGEVRDYHSQSASIDAATLNKAWDRALATFRVGAGEVVDIGNIQVFQGTTQPAQLLGIIPPKGSFAIKAGPIPDPVLKNFAERSPDLAKARIVRTMVAAAQPQ